MLDKLSSGDEQAPNPNPASTLPTEVWLLVLAWSGLRTSATAAACCTTFRDLHRTISSTPVLLARALLADHGPDKAAAHLYGGPSGEPSSRHAVCTDDGIAAAIQEMLLISDPTHSAAAFAAASAFAPDHELGCGAASLQLCGPAGRPASLLSRLPPCDPQTSGFALCTPRANTAAQPFAAATWDSASPVRLSSPASSAAATCTLGGASWSDCMSPVVTPHASSLLRAAASAGHARVAAAAMRLGARLLDGSLVGASACGREKVVRLLLASGADPDASEPFGPCALFEAARNGHTGVVQLLLDAGASIDGVSERPPGHEGSGYARVGHPSLTPGRRSGALRLAGAATGWPGDGAPPAFGAPMAPALPSAVSTALAAASASSVRVGPAASSVSINNVQDMGSIRKRQRSSSSGSDDDDDDDTGGNGDRCFDAGEPKTPPRFTAGADPAALAASSRPQELRMVLGGSSRSGAPSCRVPQLPPPLRRRPYATPLPQLLPRLPLLSPHGSPLPPLPQLTVPAVSSSPMLLMWPSQRNRATPLVAACQGGHADTVALLLRRGARVDVTRGSELLLAGHPSVVDELLTACPGLSAHLSAALVAAASGNRVAVISALLRHGADPAGNRGMALNEAAYQGHLAVVETLLKAGGAELRGNGAVAAALQLAQRWGRTRVAQLLMSASAAA